MLQTNLREFKKITIFAALILYFDAKWDFHPLDCSLVDRSDLRKILTSIFAVWRKELFSALSSV